MSFSIIILILVAHWVGDFVFQTSEMALNKNNSLGHLFHHVSLYSFFMFMSLFVYFIITQGASNLPPVELFYFWVITFVTHGIVDFFSSKKTHKLAEKENYYTKLPNFGFFSIIGLDQLIHYVTLFATYTFLFNGI